MLGFEMFVNRAFADTDLRSDSIDRDIVIIQIEQAFGCRQYFLFAT